LTSIARPTGAPASRQRFPIRTPESPPAALRDTPFCGASPSRARVAAHRDAAISPTSTSLEGSMSEPRRQGSASLPARWRAPKRRFAPAVRRELALAGGEPGAHRWPWAGVVEHRQGAASGAASPKQASRWAPQSLPRRLTGRSTLSASAHRSLTGGRHNTPSPATRRRRASKRSHSEADLNGPGRSADSTDEGGNRG
jgi:hypothetical protein